MKITYINYTGYDLPSDLPQECISDCSAQGSVDESVSYWKNKLEFNAPIEGTREYLKSFGAWDDSELNDHDINLERLLWSICCDINENSKSEE